MNHCTTPRIILSSTECTQWDSFKCTVGIPFNKAHCMHEWSQNPYQTTSNRYAWISLFIYLLACLFAYLFNIFSVHLLFIPAHREEGPEWNGNPCSWSARPEECWITHRWNTGHLSSLLDYWAQPYQGWHSCLHIGNYLGWISDMAFSGVLFHTLQW